MRLLKVLAIFGLVAPSLYAQEGGPATRDTIQGDPELLMAVQLASEGQADSARAIIRRRLATTPASNSLYPEILYAAGRVAGNADSAMLYLRRVSIEFSRSKWADQALLRLAQLAFATGDLTVARRAAERIVEDYPNSRVVADAAFWAGRAYFEQGDLEGGCRYLAHAEAAATQNVELANRIRYYRQRCAAFAEVRDSTARDTSQPNLTVYSLQVAAVGNAMAADKVMRQLAADGFETHIVTEDGLFKVRVGRFATRGEAEQMVDRLKAAMGSAPFIVEER